MNIYKELIKLQLNQKILIEQKHHFNAGFEYGSTGFQLSGNDIDGTAFPSTVNPIIGVVDDDNSYQGTQSLKMLTDVRASNETCFMLDNTTVGDVNNNV